MSVREEQQHDGVFAPLAVIESHLEAYFESRPKDRPAALHEAMRYAVLGPGKRLRPLLAWHACVAAGAAGERSLPAGAAVEFIHAFSLVHDDLPALDNDDLRRGRKTLHKHAGEAMAILAGDQLLVEAFDCLLHAEGLDEGTRLALTRELTRATSRMVSGQVYDTLGGVPGSLSAIESLRLIHENKTGALIRAACRMGAMIALGAGAEDDVRLGAITRYATRVGLMFQIVDDLVDATQSTERAGKRTGKDAAAGKATYPGVLGIEESRREVARLREEAREAVRGLGAGAGALVELADYLAERTR